MTTTLSLILFVIFILKFFAIIFAAGFFAGIIPLLGDFLKNTVFFVFQLGEKAGISVKSMVGGKNGKDNKR